MRVLSLCSGVGGLDMGLEQAGMSMVGFCELDPVCRAVLARHWPDVPTWEDITDVGLCACDVRLAGVGGERHQLAGDEPPDREPDARPEHDPAGGEDAGDLLDDGSGARCGVCGGVRRGRVDLVAGGTPCTDLSVAGRRAGLDGEHSRLFWDFCRIADGASPTGWVLWENVAGALSSNGGEDFAAVLWGLTGFRPAVPADGWSSFGVCVGPRRVATWRVLDARWFGVPQRRRRVYVVADPGDGRSYEVLAEWEGSGGHPDPSSSPWSTAAGSPGGGAAVPRDIEQRTEFVGSLTAMDGWERPDNAHAEAGWLVVDGSEPDDPVVVGPLLGGGRGDRGHRLGRDEVDGGQLIVEGVQQLAASVTEAFVKRQRAHHAEDDESWDEGDVAPTLNGFDGGDTRATVLVPVAYTVHSEHSSAMTYDGDAEVAFETEVVRSLDTSGGYAANQGGTVVAFDSTYSGAFPFTEDNEELAPTLKVGSSVGIPSPPAVAVPGAVRRLTPRECERLMGWPDDHTRWRADGTEVADTARYKMTGNGVVSSVTAWIGRRLVAADLERD